MNEYQAAVNNPLLKKDERLDALRWYQSGIPRTGIRRENTEAEINNHIHTIYSFSPYTPAMAALRAQEAGLAAAGSVDHDSIAAAEEMLEACAVLGIGGCAGFELRVSFKTGADGKPGPFAARKLNNPDSAGIAYMTVQGIPQRHICAAAEFLAPIRAVRLRRTQAMAEAANILLAEAGAGTIDFDRDVLEQSKYAEGGGITERHLLAAVAEKCIEQFGKGAELAGGLSARLGITVPPNIAALLADPHNPHYRYDLLGVLKSGFLGRIFIQPGENECAPAGSVTAFAESAGAIAAYAYLGDVGESPTGDKKAEKFEDDYLAELFEELSRLGYRAVTYMPPRNTVEQLRRVQRLCAEWGFMEISGVDINSSRQPFNCPEVLHPEFRHLLGTTWALVAHERLSHIDPRLGMFSPENPLAGASLEQRIAAYAGFGARLDLFHPEESAERIAQEL